MAIPCQIPLFAAHPIDVNERYVSCKGTQCSENKASAEVLTVDNLNSKTRLEFGILSELA